jgi:hypothetical protein
MKEIKKQISLYISLLPTGQFSNLENINFSGLMSLIISLFIIVAGVSFFFSFLLGGIKIIVSQGNKDQLDDAKRHLTNALIGIVIVLSTWAIISFVEGVFGVNLLLFQVNL